MNSDWLMPPEGVALQDHFASKSVCFGCGPANPKGLLIKSHVSLKDGKIVAEWRGEKHHEAFPGMLCGGIIGSLLDCHCNWTAAWTLMNQEGEKEPPCTVTSDYHIHLKRPTPSAALLCLEARVVECPEAGRAIVEGELFAEEKLRATCRGLFVSVQEGHPAYNRWNG